MKILIAVEDEKFGEAIVDFVAEHQWPHGSEIRLIHAIEPIFVSALAGYPTELINNLNEERHRASKSLLLTLGTEIAKKLPAIPVKEEVIDGQPKEVIVRTAREWPADLIVIGSHGRTGIGQFLLGSVSMSVLSAAPCSVMVVKLPREKQEEEEGEIKETVKGSA